MSTKSIQLKKETEIRCEIKDDARLVLKLVAGSAEIFGVEMAPNKEYSFRDQNIAVYTWYGCTIEYSGDDCGLYNTDTTPMIAYVNTHVQLEARRDVALANKDNGPRVMVVGPTDQGKSTLTQILAAYAVRLDRTPIIVDLNIGKGSFCIPGCITAAPLDKTNLNVETGFKNTTPLVFFHGYTHPKENPELYKTLITHVGQRVNDRLARDLDARASGIIVNTCGWIDEEGFPSLMHAIQALSIDIVLVVGHDKLYSTFTTALEGNGRNVTVVKLPRSGGVVTKDANTRKRLRKCLIREYFYGRAPPSSVPATLSTTLFSPERRESVPLSQFTFLRVGGIPLTDGMKVFGQSTHQDAFKLSKIVPSQELTFSVVAVLHNQDWENSNSNSNSSKDSSSLKANEVPQSLLGCNVAGFVSIVSVDVDRGVMTLLCPCPGALPSSYLLVGSVKWME